VSGCLRNVGCLTIVVLALAAGYLFRDRWSGVLGSGMLGGRASDVAPAATAEGSWTPLTDDGATRARTAIKSLGARSGPVFVTLEAAEVASYILAELTRQLPPSADSIEATGRGDRLYLRTSVRLDELGGKNVLGPLAGLLGDRERMEFGGTFDVVRPGLAQFRLRELKLRELSVPGALIPRIVREIRRGAVPEGVSADGLPLEIPPYIGDVRVSRGRVVLYKTVQ
jgi:hypothetical protein